MARDDPGASERGEIRILGAGVAGLAAAAECVRLGARVRVIDRAEGLGPAQCSWWAGGMLAPFCEAESAEDAVTELGRGAAEWWQAETGLVVRAGTLVLAPQRDRAELRRFAARTEAHRSLGPEEIAALEPDLAGRFREGLVFAEEAHLDPRRALARLAERLAEAGVVFDWGREAADLPGPAIDCRGLAALPCLPELRPVKGEMLILRSPEFALSRPVRLLHPRHPVYVVPRGDGVFMVGATTVESGDRGRVTARGAMELLSAAYALHPAFAEAEILETGADLRPAFPDNLPRVLEAGGRIHLNGLYRHGFLLAPAMARTAAAMALGAERSEPCASR